MPNAAVTIHSTKHPFTGDFSVAELALCAEANIHPLSQIQATAAYFSPVEIEHDRSSEIKLWWSREKKATETMIARMLKSAKQIGATAIINVRWERCRRDWADGLIELTATGTAIVIPNTSLESPPFLSPLSVQDLLKLRLAGYIPTGYAFGGCAYYQVAHQRIQGIVNNERGSQPKNTPNLERVDFTRGYQTAHHHAIERMQESIQPLNADGIIGIQLICDPEEIKTSHTKRSDHMTIQIRASGIAIRAVDATFTPLTCPIQYALPLSSPGGNTNA